MLLIAGIAAVVLIVIVVSFMLFRPREQPVVPSTATSTVDVPTVTPSPVATSKPTLIPTVAVAPPDLRALRQQLIDSVNSARSIAALAPLAEDATASEVASRHAQDMASFGFENTLNLEGESSAFRYNRSAGGKEAIVENVLLIGTVAPSSADAWSAQIGQAGTLISARDSDTARLLTPTATHLGIGIAYDARTQRLAISQIILARLVSVESVLPRVSLGDQVELRGHLLGASREPVLRLAYEPPLTRRSLTELVGGKTAPSPEPCQEIPLQVRADDSFIQPLTLACKGRPGLYHVQISVMTASGRVEATDLIIEVK